MVRKQIVMEAAQEAALEERARMAGVSQSALIREAIDRLLAGAYDEGRTRAWEDLRAGMDAAASSGVGGGGRAWSREELHER